jgi:hypothetical protein
VESRIALAIRVPSASKVFTWSRTGGCDFPAVLIPARISLRNDPTVRERPVSGTKDFAGTLLRQDGHIGRHIAVKFRCAHCEKGIGRAKFRCVKASADKKYQTKSCGCEERARFDRFHRTKAASTETIVARRIFERYVLEGAKKTAKRFGIGVYEANAIWQHWCRRLERKPKEHRQEVFTLAQASPERAMSKFRYAKAEVLRICWHWSESLAAQEKAAEAAKAARSALIDAAKRLFKRYAPVGSLTGSIYEDVGLYIASALIDVSDDNWEWGGFPGEFMTDALSR